MSSRGTLTGAVLSVVASLLFSATAYAQIEEVVVTARKLAENQQDVPLAITAVSGQRLAEIGKTNISDIGDLSPNVQIDSISPVNGSSNTPNINIRGIGTTDFLLTIDPSVGVYVDGVYVSRSVGGLFDLLDLERVEVLRGPQGTLFGRNTIGGAVQLVSRRPDEQFYASADVTVGTDRRTDFRGSLSGALADNVYGSVSISSKKRDGYGVFRDFFADNPQFVGLEDAIAGITAYDERSGVLLSGNSTGLAPGSPVSAGLALPGSGDQPGNENTVSARANLVWEPSDELGFSLVGDYSRSDETSPALVLLDVFADDLSAPGQGPNPVTGNDFAPNLVGLHAIFGFDAATIPYNNENFVIGDTVSTYATGPGASESEVYGLSLTADYTISERLSLKSITAYRDLDSLFGQDPDHSPFTLDAHTNDFQHSQFSQEVQLLGQFDGFQGVIGGYYMDEEGLDRVIVPLLHGLAALDQTNEIDNSNWAVFSQGTYDFNDKTSVTAGIRYSDETKDYNQVHLDCGPANALAIPDGNVVNNCNSLSTGRAGQSFSNVTYLLNLSHRFNDIAMAYVSYSTGFKSGGFTGRTTAFQPDQNPLPFAEEEAATIEAGIKTDFENLRLNVAAFSTAFENLQLTIQEGVAPITRNAADATINGLEIEAQYSPTQGFLLNAAIGLLDASYDSPPPFPIGPELANAPEFTANIGADYAFDLGDRGGITLRGDWTYKSEVFNNAENTPALRQGSVGLLNASVTWRHAGDRLSITAGGTNLTDERNLITGFFQPGVGYTEGVFNREAQWYLQATYTH